MEEINIRITNDELEKCSLKMLKPWHCSLWRSMQHCLTESCEFQEDSVRLHERTEPKDPYLIEKEVAF